jgi:hypothetical protein
MREETGKQIDVPLDKIIIRIEIEERKKEKGDFNNKLPTP